VERSLRAVLAVADQFMTHLAIWEGDDTTWGEQVTDEEYQRAVSA
jgi:hypothetical protein